MTQKLCRRLGDLEKFSAAERIAREYNSRPDAGESLARRLDEMIGDGPFEEVSPELLSLRMQDVQQQLAERARGYSRSVRAGGF